MFSEQIAQSVRGLFGGSEVVALILMSLSETQKLSERKPPAAESLLKPQVVTKVFKNVGRVLPTNYNTHNDSKYPLAYRGSLLFLLLFVVQLVVFLII